MEKVPASDLELAQARLKEASTRDTTNCSAGVVLRDYFDIMRAQFDIARSVVMGAFPVRHEVEQLRAEENYHVAA